MRIKDAREARGWTQEKLAEEIGTTQQTIQRWETGQTDVKSGQILAISKALGVTVSFIMNVNDGSESKDAISADEEELLACYRRMGEEQKKEVRNLAKMLYAVTIFNEGGHEAAQEHGFDFVPVERGDDDES